MIDRFSFRVWHTTTKKINLVWGFTPFNIVLNSIAVDNITLKRSECVLMQCTGLKDKNGKLIYEGDIVKINENYCDYSAIEDFYINQNFVVEYFQPRAVYLLKPLEYKDNDGSGIYDLSPDFYEFLKWKPCGKLEEYTLQGIEVIGNIYENPDLLENTD